MGNYIIVHCMLGNSCPCFKIKSGGGATAEKQEM